nr:hypothetical protein [Nitrospirales bacterium]
MPQSVRPDLFTINPRHQLARLHVGEGHHQVVVVDQFYLYHDEILQLALELPFTNRFEIVGNFPGVRASLHC